MAGDALLSRTTPNNPEQVEPNSSNLRPCAFCCGPTPNPETCDACDAARIEFRADDGYARARGRRYFERVGRALERRLSNAEALLGDLPDGDPKKARYDAYAVKLVQAYERTMTLIGGRRSMKEPA